MNNLSKISENINMCKGFKGRLLNGEIFSDYTTFKTGGKIPLYAEPVDEDDLKLILEFFHQQKIPSFILGGGSNIVPDDEGIDFAVISTRCLSGISVRAGSAGDAGCAHDVESTESFAGYGESSKKVHGSEDAETLFLTCGAGTPIEKITEFCIENSLSGLESFAGLPGTAGGAVYMNARCYGASVSDVLVSVRYVKCPAEKAQKVAPEDSDAAEKRADVFSFAEYVRKDEDWDYKKSPFQGTADVIVSVTFRVAKGDSAEIRSKSESFVEDRRNKGHFRFPSAGSVFKNNREFGKPSGQIIQDAGLRGLSVGGAQVAPWHGNIIVNTGNATSSDIKKLSDTVASEVKNKFGFELENEIMFVGSGIIR